MTWPPDQCPKYKQLWNTFPGAINYCNHMGNCPMPQRILKMTDRDQLLQEREKTHGSFVKNAQYYAELKGIFESAHYRNYLPIYVNALDMIALKLSRILSGQANFKDHWDDIAGYAKLASEACDK